MATEQEHGAIVWHNGKLIPWEQATIHVMTHVVHYGSSVFEGIRCYHTKHGSGIFRLDAHTERLINSAHIYRIQIDYDADDLIEACRQVVVANGYKECYLRPVIFRGYGTFGVDPFPCPIETYICTWQWGKYLGPEALEQGVDVCVSSWTRIAPNTLPSMAKAGANYMNSQLIKMEARVNGYIEGIALDPQGYISEGSGENVFLIKNGTVMTPPLYSTVLPGITRDSVIKICERMGIPVLERAIPREMLYIADEAFFTGTAAEITPIRSVDKVKVGAGKRGPLTTEIQKQFFDIITGEVEDPFGWFTWVETPKAATHEPQLA
ncbi:MAG TPA: branched-chain amino acid transaminase [Blastocatellia bacterium]|jgi:branched-chain amino acid aminotransferase|nr:branched-chain amino acid transaminase [Blastocatellia bacterium]